MGVNGEAIRGTMPWKVASEAGEGADMRFTSKDNAVHVICLKWPAEGIAVKALGRKALGGREIASVEVLGSDEDAGVVWEDSRLRLSVPEKIPNELGLVYRVRLR